MTGYGIARDIVETKNGTSHTVAEYQHKKALTGCGALLARFVIVRNTPTAYPSCNRCARKI